MVEARKKLMSQTYNDVHLKYNFVFGILILLTSFNTSLQLDSGFCFDQAKKPQVNILIEHRLVVLYGRTLVRELDTRH